MPGGNEWGICDGFRRRRRLYKDMPAFVIAVGNPARLYATPVDVADI